MELRYTTVTRQDGSTYQRKLYGTERMVAGETVEGLRQIIERDAAGTHDCNWSDDSMRELAAESLKAIEGLRAALVEALASWELAEKDAITQVASDYMESCARSPDLKRIAELRAKHLEPKP